MKLVGVPELGIQNGPAGSAGSQPVAGVPAVANANSWKVPNGIGPALANVVNAIASAAVMIPTPVLRMQDLTFKVVPPSLGQVWLGGEAVRRSRYSKTYFKVSAIAQTHPRGRHLLDADRYIRILIAPSLATDERGNL
jgi:hypothetical protein